MTQIQENNIILLGNGFCKDCLIHLIEYFNKNKESYIVVYPNYYYDNLTKITMNEMMLSYKVDSKSIYWINKDFYENHYSRMKVPFLIIKKDFEVINYDDLFDKNGYVLTKYLKN